MESYLASTVDKYIKVATKATGKVVKLKKANTPFLAEDRKSTPAGALR